MLKNAVAEKNLKKEDFNFEVDSMTLIHKNWVDQNLFRLKICLQYIKQKRTPK